MKTKNITRILTIGFILFSLYFCLMKSNKLVVMKKSEEKYADYYSLENKDLDVLFLGTSHILDSINPMELWNHFGLTGYNMAIPDCRIPTSYWILKNTLQYSKPKVVVIDIAYLIDEKIKFDYSHSFFDTIPFGAFKTEAAVDLFDRDQKQVSEMLFPFIRFHNRWKEIDESDFAASSSKLMGYVPEYGVQPATFGKQMKEDPTAIRNVSVDYLVKIIDLCKENNIRVMFIGIPFDASEASQNIFSFGAVLAEQYGINYLTPDTLLESLDTQVDYFDNLGDNSHTNFSGAQKITKAVGEYLRANYSFPEHSDEVTAEWDRNFQIYSEYKKTTFRSFQDLMPYLVKCYDEDYLFFVEAYGNHILQNQKYTNLLENMGIDTQTLSADSKNLYIVQNHETVASKTDFLTQMDFSIDSEAGKVTYLSTDEGKGYRLLLNDQIICDGTINDTARDIRITVVEKDTQRFVDSFYWTLSGDVPYGTYKR